MSKRTGPLTIGPYRCTRCRVPKAVVDFPARTYGRSAYCTPCQREYHKEKRDADRAKYNADARENRRKRMERDRERETERSRRNMLKYKYGLTPEKFDALLEAQQNACPICLRKFSETVTVAVDHDHACCSGDKTCGECVRGLLCRGCNTHLGFHEKYARQMEAYLDNSSQL